ncbi:MAG: hypothetical protein ABIX37_11885 [Gammaproteobacteria bacterium]
MPSKWPDTHIRQEILEFNREFLELIRADIGPGTAFGLPGAVRQRLALLTPEQLEAIAATPCLLVTFVAWPPRQLPFGVAEPSCAPAQADAARLFAAGLLTWLWHTARQDRLLAALCTGPGRGVVEQLASAGFRDLQRAAAAATAGLEARFCRHPRLWPDLVRAASQADTQILIATRLSAVQLTLISRK